MKKLQLRKLLVIMPALITSNLIILGFKNKPTPDIYVPKIELSYQQSLSRNIRRGANFITSVSGCYIAKFVVYEGVSDELKKWFADCYVFVKDLRHEVKAKSLEKNIANLAENDVIYVPMLAGAHFVEGLLPKINVSVVLIFGQRHKRDSYDFNETYMEQIYNNPHILKVFSQNTAQLKWKLHPKLAPFPYGFDSLTVDKYKEAFFKYLKPQNKTNGIFACYFSKRNNPTKREGVPTGPKLEPEDYFHQMAISKFTISPDGDRPECYRHYEAIGLGSIPITQMDKTRYWHLAEGPVLFNTTNWSTDEEVMLHRLKKSIGAFKGVPRTNKNLVFEEYWMEYVERVVGFELNWWDRYTKNKSKLMDLVEPDVNSMHAVVRKYFNFSLKILQQDEYMSN